MINLLTDDATVILTLKTVMRGKANENRMTAGAVALLKEHGFVDFQQVWLFANGRHESTLICSRLGGGKSEGGQEHDEHETQQSTASVE